LQQMFPLYDAADYAGRFRGLVRGRVSGHSHGSTLARVLGFSLSEQPGFALGELQVTAPLGCVRDQHLLHDLGGLSGFHPSQL
jgi:hypothetical protein